MVATGSASGLEAAVRRVAAEILAGHRGHLRELRIEVVADGVTIHGRAISFYGKQIAFHEVTRRVGQLVLANEIEVRPTTE